MEAGKYFVVTYRGKPLTYKGDSYESDKTKDVFSFSSLSWMLFSNSGAKEMIEQYKKDIEEWHRDEVPKRAVKFSEGWNRKRYLDNMKKNYDKYMKMLNSFKIKPNQLGATI